MEKMKNLLIDNIMGNISKKKAKKIIINYTKNFSTEYPSPVEITRLLYPNWYKMLVNILLNCKHIYLENLIIEIVKYYGEDTIADYDLIEYYYRHIEIR